MNGALPAEHDLGHRPDGVARDVATLPAGFAAVPTSHDHGHRAPGTGRRTPDADEVRREVFQALGDTLEHAQRP